ncbi:Omega-hydroxypalmitate O-feruloyl transferase [Platanthera zijinensis]|uniref:Omega-hydroxypalmitate O-feruloyl transferase n=1 Tax=Platanthera zijinensis TaxID=2320716 RepID=A0AAP0FYK1_9ASPA
MEGENSNAKPNLLIGGRVSRSPPVIVHPAGEFQADGSATYFLSNLDQNLRMTMKIICCYPAADRRSTDKVGEILRTSLEKVLVDFYPLDGRFSLDGEEKLIVRMNGGGVPFMEATADFELGEVYRCLESEESGGLVYCPPADSLFEVPLLTIQVTRFKCGGIVVGVAMNHALADGISAVDFLHAWAKTARGLTISLPPVLNRSLLAARCPPIVEFSHPEFTDLTGALNITAASAFSSLPILQRRFYFDLAKLSRLKVLAADSGAPPSTFAALAGLVWRARTKALKALPTDPVKILLAVDCRKRLEPPLPSGFFGNGIKVVGCVSTAGELVNGPLAQAVQMVQSAVGSTTDRFIRSGIDHFEVTRPRVSLAGTVVVSDWTRLGFGATDFGWGWASRTGPAGLPFPEVALFLPPGKGGSGTVVVLGLPAPAIIAFEEMMDF